MNQITEIFGNRIGVYGLGVTGRASLDYLAKHGITPALIDDAPIEKLQSILDEYKGKFSSVHAGDHNWDDILSSLDTIIISPGIKLPSEVDTLATNKNVKIISEIEFAYRLCKGRIIAVTGSNGKSTTVTMIHQILLESGQRSHLLGNIGTAFISGLDEIEQGDWVVLELSSYQLERIDQFRPHIALLTNITEDHLARHGTMKGYIDAKGNMFKNQDSADHAIINHEDINTTRAFGSAESTIHTFSLEDISIIPRRELINGRDIQIFACLENNVMVLRDGDDIFKIMPASQLLVMGKHNIENALCSALAGYLAGVPIPIIALALCEFKGIEHRIEFLGMFSGISFYNDSKATNVDSTITALNTFEEGYLHLMLGGSEKGSDFTPLWEFLRDRDDPFKLYLTGPSGRRMADDLKSGDWDFDFTLYNSFDECSKAAFESAKDSQIVLLSPACASFDEFQNFEKRGQRFKELLNEFLKEKGL
jgi:UDP-N-acetylmuramoylalanine--D-glutamate ligase